MKKLCNRLQKLMADKGASFLKDDPAAQEHLAQCTECFEFLEALSMVNETLSDSGSMDAPEQVIDELFAKLSESGTHTEDAEDKEGQRFTFGRNQNRIVQIIIRTAVNCVKSILSMPHGFRRGIFWAFLLVMCGIIFSLIGPTMLVVVDRAKMEKDYKYSHNGMDSGAERELSESITEREPSEFIAKRKLPEAITEGKLSQATPQPPLKPAVSPPASRNRLEKKSGPGLGIKDRKQKEELNFEQRASSKDLASGGRARQLYPSTLATMDESYGDVVSAVDVDDAYHIAEKRMEAFIGEEELPQGRLGLGYVEYDAETPDDGEAFRDEVSDTPSPETGKNEPQRHMGLSEKMILETFLNERAAFDNINYKKARGYWANTYLPGDPMYRWLDSRLSSWDRSGLVSYMEKHLKLDEDARRIKQPFDPPVNSALGVYLHADRRGIREKSRMLVQVGIQGTPRFSGSRPGMNVGIVLDLRGVISRENISCFKALLTALERARDLGDRFSLIIAGKPGGVLIQPGDFKYGHLSVAMEHLFGGNQEAGENLGVLQALQRAAELVASKDEPTAPLGSSEVILVTSQSMGGLLNHIARFAHKSSVQGIPVSVVGIGKQVNPDELNRIIYSGQGNRRLFDRPSDAARVVEQELTAVSRVIARAVRLRIRLARGVELVDVLGSHPLDEKMARKVKDAEKSIDQRMSKNLGIEADRGEDEDGIQMVIPSFYAGDSHVILLDVVVPGPGPIMDVTVRYKDLVKLKNSVARANLSLGRDTALSGPLERNVLKNLLSRRLAQTLVDAGDALYSGDDAGALKLLQSHHDMLAAVASHLPGFRRDLDISADIEMLKQYLFVLHKGLAGIQSQRNHLADSLRFAGKLKILPPLNN